MPRSSARPTVFSAWSASNAPQSPPNDHVPEAIAETSRPVLPSRTYRIVSSHAGVFCGRMRRGNYRSHPWLPCRSPSSRCFLASRRRGCRFGGACLPGKHAVELAARVDAGLGEDLVEVVLDRPRANEQSSADLRVGVPIAREQCNLSLLCGQIFGRLDSPLACVLAGRGQLSGGALGKSLGSHGY